MATIDGSGMAVLAQGIGTGRKTVPSAGTAVPLASSTPASKAIITALAANGGTVVVGGPAVVAAPASIQGTPLRPGDTLALDIYNLAAVFLDAEQSGDGVSFTYLY